MAACTIFFLCNSFFAFLILNIVCILVADFILILSFSFSISICVCVCVWGGCLEGVLLALLISVVLPPSPPSSSPLLT